MIRSAVLGRHPAQILTTPITCVVIAAALTGCTQSSSSLIPPPSSSTATGIVSGVALGGPGPAGGGIATSTPSLAPIQLNVYTMDGKQVSSVQVGQDRRYTVQLPVGKYTLDVPGLDSGSCGTAVVDVVAGQTTTHDFGCAKG